jgi:hypothetical protein
MNFGRAVTEPTVDSVPTLSRQCEFGVVELLRCGPAAWHWRCLALHATEWSKESSTTMMDAYQAAAFVYHEASRRVPPP